VEKEKKREEKEEEDEDELTFGGCIEPNGISVGEASDSHRIHVLPCAVLVWLVDGRSARRSLEKGAREGESEEVREGGGRGR